MNLENLWNDLEPHKITMKQLQKDYERGITPELPYFIVGQNEVKRKIGEYLTELDGNYFNRSLIYSDYGNGKTNLLKYLELYFERNANDDIHYLYQRANIDKPDIFLNLLKLLEDNSLEILKSAITNASEEFINKQKTENRNIAAYIEKIFKIPTSKDELILMGTGRYYAKNYYSKHSIPQLTDFDRREVFIFFMNVLSENNQYIIFALDEIEKIYEKSKTRFRSFLTSYRELIDLSGKINGHFLMSAIVSSAANIDDLLFENPAFFSRIKKDMIEVGFLTTRQNKIELVTKISSLISQEVPVAKIHAIVDDLKREYGKGIVDRSNRYLLASIFNALNLEAHKTVYMQLIDILELEELEDEFEETYEELEDEGTFSKIETRFFDPLQYYLEYKGYEINTKKENNFFKKTRLFYPYKEKKAYSFILDNNADADTEIDKLKKLSEDNESIVVFTPESVDIKYEDFDNENISIINYNPKYMFTLLVMFDELDYQDEVEKIIHEYTKGKL